MYPSNEQENSLDPYLNIQNGLVWKLCRVLHFCKTLSWFEQVNCLIYNRKLFKVEQYNG